MNKPIYAIMTSLVLILGTFAIAFPAPEANAGVNDLKLTMTCKGDINFGQATVIFRGEMKAPLGPSFIVQCFGPDEVMNSGDFPAGTTEVQIVVVCTNPDDANVSDSEKRFREGQTNFSDRSMCKLKGGSATAVLTTNF